jgi:hypothetical protein
MGQIEGKESHLADAGIMIDIKCLITLGQKSIHE